MGRYINPDQPMTDEDKNFLRSRARADEVIENERRFPPGGEPAPHEAEGFMPTKVGYDYNTQADKMEDAGGLQVERIPTDDEGRPMVEEYGYVEGITKLAPGETLDGDDDEDTIDDDILDKVMEMDVKELKAELKKLDAPTTGNKDELIDRLANKLQDARDELNKSEE